jgi:ABC-type multidrug transport system ATPase subunit
MKGRTTVVIAHRLTTVRDADKICVIKKGTVIEEGTHAELIELGGFYASLVSRQLSSDEAALELENGDAAAETNKGAEDNKAAKDKKKSTSHKKKKSSTKQ